MDGIYLDCNASAPLPLSLNPNRDAEILELLRRSIGNPSSPHRLGRESRKLVRDSTDTVHDFLNVSAKTHRIIWNSGASEGNSWIFESLKPQQRIIVSQAEHESISLAAEKALARGVEVEYCPLLPSGLIDLEELERLLSRKPTTLVSIIAAHNETGVISPLNEISQLCKKHGALLHSDCVQMLGKHTLDLSQSGLDIATFSSHKIGAPKGVGFVVLRNHEKTQDLLSNPLIFGKQQGGWRGGTENVFGIALTGLILRKLKTQEIALSSSLRTWHDEFERQILEAFPKSIVIGASSPRLANTSFIAFPQWASDTLVTALDLKDIRVSAGSACSSGTVATNRALVAMGFSPQIAQSAVRFSSGFLTNQSDFEKAFLALKSILTRAMT